METRNVMRPVECRSANDGDRPVITGYAAVFYRKDDPDTEYPLWAGAVERVMPGAFDASLEDAEIRATFDHHNLLGLLGAGTLRLAVDDVGLRYEISPSETTAYRDTLEHIRLGNITGSSFGFAVRTSKGEEWYAEKRGDVWVEVRELRDVVLMDVGPVTKPAYRGTSAATRGAISAFAEARSARDIWAKQIEENRRAAVQREQILREMQLPQF